MNYPFQHCYYCHARCPSQQSLRYADGRILCTECSQHIITTPENLQKVAVWTLDQIDDLGFKFKRGSTTATLISKEKMTAQRGEHVHGVAENTVIINMLHSSKHQQASIQVVYGMPTANLVWVLSHEIAHVIVSQQRYQFNTRAQEEGFCQLLALLVCQRSKNPQMQRVMQKEWQNPDLVYGEEFRKAYQACQQAGFKRYFAAFLK